MNAMIAKGITHVASFNTFMRLTPKISTLLRMSRVSETRIRGPSSILTVKRRVATGVISLGRTRGGVDLDVGTLRTSGTKRARRWSVGCFLRRPTVNEFFFYWGFSGVCDRECGGCCVFTEFSRHVLMGWMLRGWGVVIMVAVVGREGRVE